MNARTLKLLIIEDDPVLANIYRSRFDKAGYEVEIAADGQAGFFRLYEKPFDALLLDLMLPQISGLEILRKIRAQKSFGNLPVIVFTNVYVGNLAREALEAGANYVVFKSNTTPQQVIELFNRLLAEAAHRTAVTIAPQPTPPSLPAPPPSPPVAPASSAPAPGFTPSYTPASPWGAGAPISREGQWSGENDLLQTFLNVAPASVQTLRRSLEELKSTPKFDDQLACLREMYRRVHALTGNAGMAGLGVVSHISAVFEALLKDVCETPAYLNACSLQTISQTLEFLNQLIALGTSIEPLEMSRSTVLVVDDEAISRRVMMYAVDNAHMNPVCARSSRLALQLLEDNPFTVVITDIDLPEMNGFELCNRLRELPVHKETPVIFVTGLSNFEHRAYSVLSGGNDLVTKPILLIELTVKLVTIAIQKAIARRQKRPDVIAG